jgi:hypothetical protein
MQTGTVVSGIVFVHMVPRLEVDNEANRDFSVLASAEAGNSRAKEFGILGVKRCLAW